MILNICGILDIPSERMNAERLAFVKLTEATGALIDVVYTWFVDDEAISTVRLEAVSRQLTEDEASIYRFLYPHDCSDRWISGSLE
jgi:hypothetical protein